MFFWFYSSRYNYDVFPEELADVYYRLEKQVFAGQSVAYEIQETLTKDGQKGWVDNRKYPIKDDTGQIIGLFGIARDITERKRMEDALRESEEMMRSSQSVAHICSYSTNLNTNEIEKSSWVCSPEFYKIFGIDESYPHTIAGWASCIHPDYREEVFDYHESVVKERKPFSLDYKIIRFNDGAERWVHGTGKLEFDDQGNPVRMHGAIQDVTERKNAEDILKINERRYKRAQEALQKSEERLNLALDSVTDAVWDWRVDTGEVYFSSRWYTMLGYEPYEKPQEFETWRNLLHPDDLPNTERFLFSHLNEAEPFEMEFRMRTKDDQWRWILARGKTVEIDDQGKAVRMLGTHMDITERKKMEERLRQSQKIETVGQLAGGIAHDFNNMLGVILGHTEMALEKIDPTEPLFTGLRAVQEAAERSAALTRQLLTFARKQTIAPKVIDLNETVAGMLKMLHRLIGENIDLLWRPGGNHYPVKVDPSQIDQILANLCVNARDAIAGVGKITIETNVISFDEAYCAEHVGFRPGEYILLGVSDDGCGMDRETLGHIFEPFFTTKEQGKGTGLGLASVYGAVKQNNGFINVYSEPGQGTIVRIYLPRYAAKSANVSEEAPDHPTKTGHETILLVEDEPAILEMTTTMLGRLGYTVVAASTAGEAIRLAHENSGRIDLLMTDVVMPEMNGRDLAGNLLNCYPGLKRLFMSGYTANVIAHHGVLDEGVHFIQKPFSKKELGVKLREALEG